MKPIEPIHFSTWEDAERCNFDRKAAYNLEKTTGNDQCAFDVASSHGLSAIAEFFSYYHLLFSVAESSTASSESSSLERADISEQGIGLCCNVNVSVSS